MLLPHCFDPVIQANSQVVGGPDRPPSQRMIEQTRSDEQAERMANRQAQSAATSSSTAAATPGSANEGYWAYMVSALSEWLKLLPALTLCFRHLCHAYRFLLIIQSRLRNLTKSPSVATTDPGADGKSRHHRRINGQARGQQLGICRRYE